jgi:LPXTG-motif cell wall-anchored protein
MDPNLKTTSNKTYIWIIFGLVLVILFLVYLYSKKKQPEPMEKLSKDENVTQVPGSSYVPKKSKAKKV